MPIPPEGFEPSRARGPRRSECRAYAFRHGGKQVALRREQQAIWLRRESNPHRAGLQPAALPVSYKSLDEADGTRAEGGRRPTRNLPRDSRARSPLRHGFKDIDAGQPAMARRTNDAPTRESRDLV
jgi:hypothetical protein